MANIRYNTSEKKLILPEYGRHIQQLVDHCLTIEDRDERTRCAYAIASLMKNMTPTVKESEEKNKKIWDHICIMSGFNLDIDFPVEVITEEELNKKPKTVPYARSKDRFRNYGNNIQKMIIKAAEMDNCVEKDNLIFLVANQMKKILVSQNPENAGDEKVFKDIYVITEGKIKIDPEAYRLNEYIGVVQPSVKKKKKK